MVLRWCDISFNCFFNINSSWKINGVFMTKYQTLHARLNTENRYLLEERAGIKEDSGISKDEAEK